MNTASNYQWEKNGHTILVEVQSTVTYNYITTLHKYGEIGHNKTKQCKFSFSLHFLYSVESPGGRNDCLEKKHQVAGWTSGAGLFWFICAFQNYVADLFTSLPFVSPPPKFCPGNHPHPPNPTNHREYPPLQGAVSSTVRYTHIHTSSKIDNSHRESQA